MFLFTSTFHTGTGVAVPPPEPIYEIVSDDPNIGGMWAGVSPNNTTAQRYPVGHAGKIVGAGMHVRDGTATLRLALYSDNAGAPDALLCQAEVAVSTATSAWFDVEFDPEDQVTVGVDDHVWLARQVSDEIYTWRSVWPEAHDDTQFVNVTWASGMPDPYGSGSFGGNAPQRLKIWTNP